MRVEAALNRRIKVGRGHVSERLALTCWRQRPRVGRDPSGADGHQVRQRHAGHHAVKMSSEPRRPLSLMARYPSWPSKPYMTPTLTIQISKDTGRCSRKPEATRNPPAEHQRAGTHVIALVCCQPDQRTTTDDDQQHNPPRVTRVTRPAEPSAQTAEMCWTGCD